jgi:hypothetical protein
MLFYPKSMHQNLKSPRKNSGSEPRVVGFNSGVKQLMVMRSQLHVPATLFLYPVDRGISLGSSARHNHNNKISGPVQN